MLRTRLVDMLPKRLWRPGNVHVGMRLHFCASPDKRGVSVRTVEWNGREVACGRRTFDLAAYDTDG